jgi:hypothetical protein
MTKKMNTELFIVKANEVHNNFYDYSKTTYINYKTKLTIICPLHGEFEQRIDHHLNGFKCKLCGCKTASQKRLITKEQFLERAQAVHGTLYDYSLFIPCKAKEKIQIICNKHGVFEQSYEHHINQKSQCPKCSQKNGDNLKRKSLTDFVNEANSIHNRFYSYGKSIYESNRTKLVITCPDHGDFEQTPSNHLQGKGCKECVKDTNAFHKEGFKQIANGRECIFYILKCFNDTEVFYKIGITCRSVQQRYSNKYSMPYEYTIMQEIKGTADYVWDKEKEFKNKYKTYLYTPNIKFAGSKTECFNENAISLEFP